MTDRDRVIACGLTDDEADCWELAATLARKLFALPKLHQMDDHEVAHAIHVIQNKLLGRPAYRQYLQLAQGPQHDSQPSNEQEGGERAMTIEGAKRKYEEQLMRLPNVTGIGIGEKAGRQVMKVFVTHKVPESALRPEEIIPKTLEGVETDVEEIGVVTAQSQ